MGAQRLRKTHAVVFSHSVDGALAPQGDNGINSGVHVKLWSLQSMQNPNIVK